MASSAAQEMVVNSLPETHPDPATTFRLQPIPSPPTAAPAGELLLALKVVSVDPYLRGVLRRAPLNEPMSSGCVAEVVDSQHAAYTKGDVVVGVMPWRTVQAHSGAGLRKVDRKSDAEIPLSAWLGVCGMPGRTAFFGLLDHEVGRMQPGQTVVVSGAAGAVGSLAGQLARLKGAKRVIGTAGGPAKCRLVVERYGFDACLDYKQHNTAELMAAALKAAAPDGIDLYFDNTSGHVTTAVFECFNRFGRMVLCGAIDAYNKTAGENLIPNPFGLHTIYKSINIRAFLQGDFQDRFQEFYAEIPELVKSGKLRYDETRYVGFDKIGQAFAGLFKGENTGKAVIIVSE